MEFREFIEKDTPSDFDVLNLYLNRSKVSEISCNTGRSIGEIYRVLKKYDISPNRLKTKHGQVLGFSQGGFNIGEIAKLTGYSKRNVRYILSGQINEGN